MPKNALKIVVFIFLLTASASTQAQKTDIVILVNGDKFTGEIRSMKFAQLNFNMTSTGTIQVKWVRIVNIYSDKTFQLTMKNGEVQVAKLDSVFFRENQIILDDIVEIVRIKDKFLQRLSGNIDLGFSYTKSSDILQFNFNSSITYRKPKKETGLVVNSVISSKSTDTTLNKNQNATFSYLRSLNKRYYLKSSFGWQQNTELGISSRFILTGGGGKIIVNDNHHRLLTGTGLSYNLEQSDESDTYTSSVEALFSVQFKRFQYLTPKMSIDAFYNLYPGLSDWGRVRMDLNINAKYEIFKDFNVGLNLYYNYDNRPPAGATSTNDYGLNFTLGYEFGK